MSVTIERAFHLAPRAGRRGGWRQSAVAGVVSEPAVEAAVGVHPLARRMAMAIVCMRLIRDGAAADAASLAGVAGITRARMTHILNLTLLAPDIQAQLLELPIDSHINERLLRAIVVTLDWARQRQQWDRLPAVSSN